jgi:hypothetical protein
MPEKLKKWKLFMDRTESLLRRWDAYADKNPEVQSEKLIKACLEEINDGYTRGLLKGDT